MPSYCLRRVSFQFSEHIDIFGIHMRAQEDTKCLRKRPTENLNPDLVLIDIHHLCALKCGRGPRARPAWHGATVECVQDILKPPIDSLKRDIRLRRACLKFSDGLSDALQALADGRVEPMPSSFVRVGRWKTEAALLQSVFVVQ